VEIEAYSQGTSQLVDQYFFSDAVLTALQVSGSSGFTGDSVSFDFGGFAHSHQELDAKGAAGPVSSVGWDFVNAAPGSVPAHTADALSGEVADSLPIDAPLSYFVTYDGAPGWLQASSFSTGMSGGAGPATAEDVMLALGSSKQLVELTQTLLSGKHLKSVEVEAYRMDSAQPQLVDEYKFEDVVLNGLSAWSPTENGLSFSYAKYAEGHIANNADGTQGTITTGGWDFSHNTAFSGGTPHADIDFTA
jgi:type VI protein secretion system component Hcp